MLEAVNHLPFAYVLCGVILAVVFGLAAGNYACSLVHRLPRGKLLLDKAPYCGSCGTLLGVKDLFPVISAVLLKHRCRYCGAPFPTSHTWTEALVALLFVLLFLRFGFTEQFLLVALIGIFLITLAAIEANEQRIMGKVLVCILVPAMIYRTLQDGTIHNFFSAGLFGLMIGAVLQFRQIKKVGHIYSLPAFAQLLAVGGVCVGAQKLPIFLMVGAGLLVLGKALKWPVSVGFALAVMAVVMYF